MSLNSVVDSSSDCEVVSTLRVVALRSRKFPRGPTGDAAHQRVLLWSKR